MPNHLPSLQSANWINFSDHDNTAHSFQGLGATFSNLQEKRVSHWEKEEMKGEIKKENSVEYRLFL